MPPRAAATPTARARAASARSDRGGAGRDGSLGQLDGGGGRHGRGGVRARVVVARVDDDDLEQVARLLRRQSGHAAADGGGGVEPGDDHRHRGDPALALAHDVDGHGLAHAAALACARSEVGDGAPGLSDAASAGPCARRATLAATPKRKKTSLYVAAPLTWSMLSAQMSMMNDHDSQSPALRSSGSTDRLRLYAARSASRKSQTKARNPMMPVSAHTSRNWLWTMKTQPSAPARAA